MSTEVAKTEQRINGVSREGTRGGQFFCPNVDIVEMENELRIKADMPGTTADKVSVNYDKGVLTLHGSVEGRQSEKMPYLVREYEIGDFHREFIINEDIDHGRISAEYKNGVLNITLPKSEAAKPKRIEVKSM